MKGIILFALVFWSIVNTISLADAIVNKKNVSFRKDALFISLCSALLYVL